MQRPFRYAASLLAIAALCGWTWVHRPSNGASFPGCSVANAQDAAKPPTIAEQFATLLREFQLTANRYSQSTNTDDERKQLVERADKVTLKTLALAENNLKETNALEMLTAVVSQEYWLNLYSSHPGWGKDSPQAKAIALILRDYLQSDKLAEPCRRVSFCFRQECETLLRTVMEKNPHHEIQGVACLYLGQFLANRLDRIDLFKDQPELADRYETVFGKEYIDSLRHQDRVQAIKEIEGLYDRAIEQYAEVKLPWNGTVGQQAKIELFGFQQLAIGKTAPEIEGVDQEGQQFKISDYRGKVVLLYFWSEY